MNCIHCLTLPERQRHCDAYPQGWPSCEGRISVNGMAKHEDIMPARKPAPRYDHYYDPGNIDLWDYLE